MGFVLLGPHELRLLVSALASSRGASGFRTQELCGLNAFDLGISTRLCQKGVPLVLILNLLCLGAVVVIHRGRLRVGS